MIKFFRKIRQKLLTENKFSKYAMYAIGEILLVVIGILIALQINNWNEKRKNVRYIESFSIPTPFKQDSATMASKVNLYLAGEEYKSKASKTWLARNFVMRNIFYTRYN